MKLLLMIIASRDYEQVRERLVEAKFGITQIATTGGFLRQGNTTVLVGTEENRVDEVIDLLNDATGQAEEEGQRRATVFVLDVERFDQL